jgi:cellulose synthase/poly-beta-1,6-N-acetylglucosamine synthase-like glycosyltransferase
LGQQISVVVPSASKGNLLDGCLEAIASQVPAVHEVILVDDSPDGVLSDLDGVGGVRVLRSGGVGPYGARNVGWRAATSEIVLFADSRSRPRPTWAARLAAVFADDEVVLAGTETVVVRGSSYTARAAAVQQPFRVEAYVDDPWFRPYLATCNLAVRRSALERTDGFRTDRSGGDADLCWRVLDGGGRLEVVREPLMEWVPRERFGQYLEQHYRYGGSNVRLRRTWQSRGAEQVELVPLPRLLAKSAVLPARFAWAAARRRDDRVEHLIVEAGALATRLGARRATRRLG